MGAVSIERLTMVWEMRLVLPVVDLDHHWQLAQVSSDGGHILATELVCFVNCPAFPLTPVHEVLENSDAEGMSQSASREQDDPRLRAV